MSNPRNNEWFSQPGRAMFDHEKQQIATVLRVPSNLLDIIETAAAGRGISQKQTAAILSCEEHQLLRWRTRKVSCGG
jgi:predicted DNA binding CopG/RHH family protein